MTVDCGTFLQERIDAGENVMLEGAQGTSRHRPRGLPLRHLLEPDRRRATIGTGLPTVVGDGEVIGIVKAYLSSRDRPAADRTRRCRGPDARLYATRCSRGRGRTRDLHPRRRWGVRHRHRPPAPRRLARHADAFATRLVRTDSLDWQSITSTCSRASETVEVGHSYEFDTAEQSSASNQNSGSSDDGEEIFTMPPTTEQWGRCEATFKSFDGWPEVDWAAVADDGYEAIPENARTYLEYRRRTRHAGLRRRRSRP